MKNVFDSLRLKWAITFLHLQITLVCAQSVQLIWTPNQDPNISRYGAYRKPHVDSNFVLIGTVDHPDSAFVDETIEWNSHYFYAVTALDVLGNESDFSNIGEIETTFPALGRIKNGDESHPKDVSFNFRGVPGNLALLYQAYDIDTENEVDVILNGVKIYDEKTTADLTWGSTRALFLADAKVNDTGTNEIRFVNIDNTNNGKRFYWGIRGARISTCMPLPHTDGVGRIKQGDQTHFNEACFTFAGQRGDVSLKYEVYDIDHVNELDILLNGTKIHDESVTSNNGWSSARSLLLPDALVSDTETNVLVFDNTKNPPTNWFWGVRNLTFTRAPTQTVAVDQSQLTRTQESDGTLQLNFTSTQNLEYLLLYPTDDLQNFSSYRIEASLDGQDWQTLVDKSSARVQGVQFDQIPGTLARFLRVSGTGYVSDWELLHAAELSEESYAQVFEEMMKKAVPSNLAITEIIPFRQVRPETNVTDELTLPHTYSLSQNYPNPFNPTTVIEYSLPERSNVTITIFSLSGQEVRRLVDETKLPGNYKVEWDGKDTNGMNGSSGVYFYQMIAGDYRGVKKIVFKK